MCMNMEAHLSCRYSAQADDTSVAGSTAVWFGGLLRRADPEGRQLHAARLGLFFGCGRNIWSDCGVGGCGSAGSLGGGKAPL